MRIIAGRHRGRTLQAPAGQATRPTADRVRQALFDMLWHAPWSPFSQDRALLEEVRVLDAFAGTGALGLEALSRGAAQATFLETDRAALTALRANIAACREEARCRVLPADATKPPRAAAPCGLVFLDPPYRDGLMEAALAALAAAGWIAPGALVCAEYGADPGAAPPGFETLASRGHGAAHLRILRAG
ncbi:16S rRNA (guanine(966)-N(2))-methyltransferase RsmD [Paracraurococcus ruber]|uniref:16S rRNA (Guanine(966)-N(2))-methyltransferase RsmD n=1 Tax=Paracraurococcus ruber TaxID=77675 RepID=A0ABS1CVB2_9PROT|nr:16S rRNA (guanine(966)-N(2))-methyltransferase RsmD [Paracraurococcus ruber]MBK1658437.1 16S rRNA (guanine(966)-N(2))-methyltransferase RsmD [Paracraurococcus ruber]TDG27002.1 16S rRNA (guanine(966)-N(2))-methyltransferase RsmD [Paracraurococcus ruber]